MRIPFCTDWDACQGIKSSDFVKDILKKSGIPMDRIHVAKTAPKYGLPPPPRTQKAIQKCSNDASETSKTLNSCNLHKSAVLLKRSAKGSRKSHVKLSNETPHDNAKVCISLNTSLKNRSRALKATPRAPSPSRRAEKCKKDSAEVPPGTLWGPPKSPAWLQFASSGQSTCARARVPDEDQRGASFLPLLGHLSKHRK